MISSTEATATGLKEAAKRDIDRTRASLLAFNISKIIDPGAFDSYGDIRSPKRAAAAYATAERILAAISQTLPAPGEVERLRQALRNIAEGNLGDAPWQANYARIKEVAAEALATVAAANDEGVALLLAQAEFLCDRLDELDWSQDLDGVCRDYSGHVDPALSRLKSTIALATSRSQDEGASS